MLRGAIDFRFDCGFRARFSVVTSFLRLFCKCCWIERLPVEGKLTLYRSRLEDCLHHVATILRIAHNLSNLVRRFVGSQFAARSKAQTLCLYCLTQHGTFIFESRSDKDLCFVDMRFEHFPVPGNLREQSKRQREAEVS